jgi:hypothetical protein
MRTASLLALMSAVAMAGNLLLRLDAPPVDVVQSGGVVLLDRFDGWVLATADERRLPALAGATVLDRNPAAHRYVYAMPEGAFDRKLLAGCGTVLASDPTGVLLRVDEAGVLALNRLPVQLYAISQRQMYLAQTLNPEPGTPLAGMVDDSLVWTLVNKVSMDSLESDLRRFIGFGTRYATTESCRSACAWMRSQLASYGCDTTYLDTFTSTYAPNVVGVRTGKTNPRRIFVITGHIDNTSETPQTRAPGSDDNASGVGLVLEAARVFADVDFDCTVWFIGFSAEEQGLVGSDSFVYACRQRGDSIIAAIHSDMISYARDDSATIVFNSSMPETESLAHFFLAQADTFTALRVKDTIITSAMSDHYSFWKYGYPAIRNRYHDRTPMYHTTGDTIGPFHYANCGTNNLPLYAEVVRATVATVAKWAGAHQPTGVEENCGPQAARFKLTVVPTVGAAPVLVYLSPAVRALSVYDASGRLVCTLSTRRNASGVHWDGRDESGKDGGAGVFYFRAQGAGAATRFVRVR